MKKFRRILLVVLLVIVIAGVALGIWIYNKLNADVIDLEEVDGDIAFISDRDGSWDIFILETDGTLRNLTKEGDGADYLEYMTFSADYVYFYNNRTGDFNPARVKIDGTGLETMNYMVVAAKTLSSGHLDMDPTWSPDGSQLAWAKTRGFTNDICVAPVDDVNNFRCLTEGQKSNLMPAWSPDGTKLAFVSDRGGNFQDLFVADAASGEQSKLTNGEGWAFQPMWSLDGGSILFAWNLEDDSLVEGWFDFHLVKPDGSDLHRMAEGEVFSGDPNYSPSGKQVIYVSNESGHWQIYVMDSDGSNVRQLTEGDSNNLFPVWVPKPAE